MANELFNFRELVQPLTPDQRLRAVETVVRDALYGLKYVYSMKDMSGNLHWSKDMIYDALFYAMIDSLPHKEDKSA